VTARHEIERIAAEHRAATDRIIDRIDAIDRAARRRSAQLADQPSPAARAAPGHTRARAVPDPARAPAPRGAAPDDSETEQDPPASWLA
jgi:hypothetical protein